MCRMIYASHALPYVLERIYMDNMINRSICSPIAVAETKEELIDFCRSMYGEDIPFYDNGNTPTTQTPMGEASFQIKVVAHLMGNNWGTCKM